MTAPKMFYNIQNTSDIIKIPVNDVLFMAVKECIGNLIDILGCKPLVKLFLSPEDFIDGTVQGIVHY
jgi:hypothetical protein